MSSFAKACADFSNNIRNFRFSKSSSNSQSSTNHVINNSTKDDTNIANFTQIQQQIHSTNNSSNPISPKGSPIISRGVTVAAIKQRLFNQGLKIEISPKKKKRTRFRDYAKTHFEKNFHDSNIWNNPKFLSLFFSYFNAKDLNLFCLVCKNWKSIITSHNFYNRIKLVCNFKLHSFHDDDSKINSLIESACLTIKLRKISSLMLEHVNDKHVILFIEETMKHQLEKSIVNVSIKCSSINDKALQKLTESYTNLNELELFCCNDLSEVSLWSSLVPNITTLTLWDCINISDESIGAVTQLLPNLREFNLQAYHVTDTAFTYFSTRPLTHLVNLSVVQCMDITNQGVVNIAHALPGLSSLSLSGISKLTDDGLDVVCESMKQITFLDLSWCPKLTDSGLECVACDLALLQELILDRCPSITDNGINYLSTMTNLSRLSLRWCNGITDLSLTFLLSMTNLQYLSIAGCKRFSEEGICTLVRHSSLRKIEITHCRASTERVKQIFQANKPFCILID